MDVIVLQINIECLICYSFYCKYSYGFVLKLYNIIITIIIESFFCPTVGKFTVFFFLLQLTQVATGGAISNRWFLMEENQESVLARQACQPLDRGTNIKTLL